VSLTNAPQAVRPSTLEKGGGIAGLAAVLSEFVQQLSQGVVRQSELVSNFFHGSLVDKHGAQCLVTAVIEIGWPSEERAAGGVIHDQALLKMSVGFLRKTDEMVKSNQRAVDANQRQAA
jgi:hypothetical protein